MALELIMGIEPDTNPMKMAEEEQNAKYATGVAYAGSFQLSIIWTDMHQPYPRSCCVVL